jgi:hypothetical protein
VILWVITRYCPTLLAAQHLRCVRRRSVLNDQGVAAAVRPRPVSSLAVFPANFALLQPLSDQRSRGSLGVTHSPTLDSRKSRLWAARGTKINSFDPPLTAVCTAYATPPFLPFFHPPIELAGFRPRGRLHLNRRIDFSAICFGAVLHVSIGEIHV